MHFSSNRRFLCILTKVKKMQKKSLQWRSYMVFYHCQREPTGTAPNGFNPRLSGAGIPAERIFIMEKILRALGLVLHVIVYGYEIPTDNSLRQKLIQTAQNVDPYCKISYPTKNDMCIKTWYKLSSKMYDCLQKCYEEYVKTPQK